MIFALSKEERMKALAKILPFQRDDFENIFRSKQKKPNYTTVCERKELTKNQKLLK